MANKLVITVSIQLRVRFRPAALFERETVSFHRCNRCMQSLHDEMNFISSMGAPSLEFPRILFTSAIHFRQRDSGPFQAED
jgi:hypothetical protein